MRVDNIKSKLAKLIVNIKGGNISYKGFSNNSSKNLIIDLILTSFNWF